MIYCKQIPIPILDIDITKIKSLYTKGYHLFNVRYHANPYWRSFDIIKEFEISPILVRFPSITSWFASIKKYTGITKIKHSYISVLDGKHSIPWHSDSINQDFNKSFITAISTKNSFIELNDVKYSYEDGYSYIFKSGIRHRIINFNDDLRITLCTTPEENPYV